MGRFLLDLAILALFVAAVVHDVAAQVIPPAAHKYRAELVRASQYVWGLNAPIPAMAAQVHQESMWRKDVCSPYACGLTQFTPATAEWIQSKYGAEFGPMDRFDPKWAIRAMARYDKFLYDRVGADDCNSFWMALWGYNGGEGWRIRDQRKAKLGGANSLVALEVEPYNAGRHKAAFHENRTYPRRILWRHQTLYAHWGRTVCLSPENGYGTGR